jgi:hypothetical protein
VRLLRLPAQSLLADDYEGEFPLEQRRKVVDLILTRWEYLHVPLHSAAYVINPRFVGSSHLDDPEVRDDFQDVLTQMLPDADAVAEAMLEYMSYNKKEGIWSQPTIWLIAKTVEPAAWWDIYKSNTVWLGNVAALILRATHSAGALERMLSTEGRVNSKARASMLPSTIARWTRCAHNQRLIDRKVLRGKARDRAIARVNARRTEQPRAGRSTDFPLTGDAFWASADEDSDDPEMDIELAQGPSVPQPPPAARRARSPVSDSRSE